MALLLRRSCSLHLVRLCIVACTITPGPVSLLHSSVSWRTHLCCGVGSQGCVRRAARRLHRRRCAAIGPRRQRKAVSASAAGRRSIRAAEAHRARQAAALEETAQVAFTWSQYCKPTSAACNDWTGMWHPESPRAEVATSRLPLVTTHAPRANPAMVTNGRLRIAM